ncbi:hypothetical protein H0H93_007865 [Arthromyces matolae]|nr:hypothetical protein H0H93_007865 [Arthromyces matolae]
MQRPPHLDALQRSPVRGQLEPHDSRTATGWRYIQTTETPNQLKILLPPGTAAMYEQLLKLEDFELRKGSSLSWERLLEIRHLKDRMIRKCQKLGKPSLLQPGGKQVGLSFQTIVAPSDFRLKEMERWFLDQHARTQQKWHEKESSNCKCSKCLISSSVQQPSSSQPTTSKSNAVINISQGASNKLYQRPRYPSQSASPPRRRENSASIPSRVRSVDTLAAEHPSSQDSPAPLPHLLRIRDLETGFDRSNDPQKVVSLPKTTEVQPQYTIEPESGHIQPPEQLPADPDRQVRRRPSCIKRSSTSKRVSWADNQDLDTQVAKYTSVARETQASGLNWDEIRDTYVEQMSGLEALHQQVGDSLKHLRSESEHLKRAEETIRSQREMLRVTFEEFERKQLRFQSKGKAKLATSPKDLKN